MEQQHGLEKKIKQLDESSALKLLRDLKAKSFKPRQKSVRFPKQEAIIVKSKRKAQCTVSPSEALAFILGELLEGIDKKSMPTIKSLLVEAVEWLAVSESDPRKRHTLRMTVRKWIMLDDREDLIKRIGSFAALHAY